MRTPLRLNFLLKCWLLFDRVVGTFGQWTHKKIEKWQHLYKYEEPLPSGKLIMAVDLLRVQRKLMCDVWWIFHPSYFAEGLILRITVYSAGYVTPHTKKTLWFENYPSFSRLWCPDFFSSSNTIACTQEIHSASGKPTCAPPIIQQMYSAFKHQRTRTF